MIHPAASGSRSGRFAPSPTGSLHLGNLRTALVAWLAARSTGSAFRLRMEDLDPLRSRLAHQASQLADLRTLGLDWDGAVVHQSRRRDLHAAAFAQLRAADAVYPCWCSRADVRKAVAAPHGHAAAHYPGTCRGLSPTERTRRGAAGSPAWRLRAAGTRVTIVDAVHAVRSAVVDDVVVWRNDGVPAYNLAVVVDDADMGIGEVVRGDDLLDAACAQTLVARLLGLPEPRWVHVPLVLGPDGRRLAKRHGAVTLGDSLAGGRTVPDVVGTLAASLGLSERGRALMPADLVDGFSLAALPTTPSLLAEVS